MVLKNKKLIILLIFYLFVTTFVFVTSHKDIQKNMSLFFQDSNIKYRVEIALALSPNTHKLPIGRVFFNKLSASGDNFTNSIYRSIDPVFLFSLSKTSSSLFDDPGPIRMLYPIEFPFFLIAMFYILRNWSGLKKNYFFLVPSLLVSLFIAGLFLPAQQPVKLIPLILVIRTTTFIGVAEILKRTKWAKKLYLFS